MSLRRITPVLDSEASATPYVLPSPAVGRRNLLQLLLDMEAGIDSAAPWERSFVNGMRCCAGREHSGIEADRQLVLEPRDYALAHICRGLQRSSLC